MRRDDEQAIPEEARGGTEEGPPAACQDRRSHRTTVLLAVPTPAHVVVVVEENHSYDEVIGASDAPFINSLANGGASFTNSHAITHPSQPNYLALFSGSTQGVTDDNSPAPSPAKTWAPSSTRRASRSPDTPKTFPVRIDRLETSAAGMPASTIRGRISRTFRPRRTMPFSEVPDELHQLPTVAFVVPNMDNDMHDGTVRKATSGCTTISAPTRRGPRRTTAC